MPTPQEILEQLKRVAYPGLSRDIVAFGFVKDIDQELAVNSGENRKNQSDREALVAAAQEPDPAVRLARLEKVLEVFDCERMTKASLSTKDLIVDSASNGNVAWRRWKTTTSAN